MILTQKLKLAEEQGKGADSMLKMELSQVKNDNELLQAENEEKDKKIDSLNDELEDVKIELEKSNKQEKKFKDLNRQLEFQVEELMEQLETADKAR